MKWARFNLGANEPESAGLYFSWGNLDGHPAGAGYDFSLDVYNATPAADISTNLSLDHDAARANLGAPWRMPTAAEFQELVDNCTSVWTSLNGINGRLFTSNVNGKTLFLPAAGRYGGTSLIGRGSSGIYWTSTYSSPTVAHFCNFDNSDVHTQGDSSRYFGFTVRPVQDGTPNRSIIPPTPEDEPKEEETPTTEEPKDKDER